MQQRRTKNQFWYLFGPLLIKWAIDFVVEGAAGAAYIMLNASRLDLGGSQETLMNQAMTLSLELTQYSVEIAAVSAVITLIVMGYLFHRDRVCERRQGMPARSPIPLFQYGAIAVMGIGTCVAFNNLLILSSISSVSQAYQATSERLYQSPLWLQLAGLGVLIPIAEELVYRGLLYKRMRENMPMMISMVFSAIIFGVTHGNLVQFIYAGGLGLLLAYTYEKTGTLKAPIVLHIVMNLTSVVGTKARIFDWMFQNMLWLSLSTAAAAAVAAAMFVIIRNIKEKASEITDSE